MYYVLMRNQNNVLLGFMVDDDEIPIPFDTEVEAEKATRGHIAEPWMETIEL